MSKELAPHQDFMTVADMKRQVGVIHQIMKTIMKSDTHYGIIPGTQKPTLYKPGAEKIMMAFHLTADTETETLMDDDDEYRVRIKTKMYNRAGDLLGTGLGEASSSEEKYKWRRAICDEEWDEADADRKREKWFKGYQGKQAYKQKQIRTQVADIRNTIVKMCAKRSLIAAILNVTAAGDLFTQDIEDMSPEIREEIMGDAKPTVDMPQETPAATPPPAAQKPPAQKTQEPPREGYQGTITPAQIKLLHARKSKANVSDQTFEAILTWNDVQSVNELNKDQVDTILAEIEKNAGK